MFVFGIPVEPIIGVALIIAVFTALIVMVRKDTYVPQAISNYHRNRYEENYTADAYEIHYGYDRKQSGFYNY